MLTRKEQSKADDRQKFILTRFHKLCSVPGCVEMVVSLGANTAMEATRHINLGDKLTSTIVYPLLWSNKCFYHKLQEELDLGLHRPGKKKNTYIVKVQNLNDWR